MAYNTTTVTFTVIDIRKTFENFEADLRMIARRTNMWTQDYVSEIAHDIIKLAEAKYLNYIDITLVDAYNQPIRAVRYNISLDGRSMKGVRAGGNNWTAVPNSKLRAIIFYNSDWHNLTDTEKNNFQQQNHFKINWTSSSIDTTYSHLNSNSARTYASKGYELNKIDFI